MRQSSPVGFVLGVVLLIGAGIQAIPYFVDTNGIGVEKIFGLHPAPVRPAQPEQLHNPDFINRALLYVMISGSVVLIGLSSLSLFKTPIAAQAPGPEAEPMPAHLPPNPPPTGPVLRGRFELLSVLGRGGMAVVFDCYDRVDERRCAVKLMLPHFAQGAELRRRFAAEVQSMRDIGGDRIVEVYHADVEADVPLFAMELAPGGSLMDLIESTGPLSVPVAVHAAVQLCLAVEGAHQAGVLHRDIKPHNLLMNAQGRWMLTDFGIALGHGGGLTKTGAAMGTLAYMAPEQRADARSVDARSDVYSIGATIYKALTADTVTDLFIAEHNPALLEGVDPQLRPVVLRCVAYRQADRYQTVAELRQALEMLATPLQASAVPVPPVPLRPLPASEYADVASYIELQPLSCLANPTVA